MERRPDRMQVLEKFEGMVITLLSLIMALVLLLSIIELGHIIVKDVISPPIFFVDINELKEVFGHALFVMIGIEILKTVEAYAERKAIPVEAVLIVALIAVTRKVIILDVKTVSAATLAGLGGMIIALSAGYYLIKRVGEQGQG